MLKHNEAFITSFCFDEYMGANIDHILFSVYNGTLRYAYWIAVNIRFTENMCIFFVLNDHYNEFWFLIEQM